MNQPPPIPAMPNTTPPPAPPAPPSNFRPVTEAGLAQVADLAQRQDADQDERVRWRPAEHEGRPHVAWSQGRMKATNHVDYGPGTAAIVERMAVIQPNGQAEWFNDVQVHQQVLQKAFAPGADGSMPPPVMAGILGKAGRAFIWEPLPANLQTWIAEWLATNPQPPADARQAPAAPVARNYTEEPF